jgi:hypothetical protein
MKVTQQHIQYMADRIKPVDTVKLRQSYVEGNYENSGKTKDPDKRYRWDLFWQAGLARFAVDVLYKYVNDEHIDTALRSIVPPLKKGNADETRAN